MPLFNAAAWMMKGGGSSATISNMSDSDPYTSGKTPVSCKIRSASLVISNGDSRFVVSFTLESNGFVVDPSNVEMLLEVQLAGSWRYIIPNKSVNFSTTGSKKIDISSAINKNASAKKALLETHKLYLLFQNSKEIISDQVGASIEKK